jgi:uncharacterized protein (UPF0548 family)
MWLLKKPSNERIQAFLAGQARHPFSYAEVGASHGEPPAGYDWDHRRLALGKGSAVFESACSALRRWAMFPRPWTEIHPESPPIQQGATVALLFRVLGLWGLNACRIVYLLDDKEPIRRLGFAYGTLPDHVERGEERFSIEWDADDTVWYDLRAFSRPHSWLVRLGYPIARRLQRRFALDSQAAMQKAVAGLATANATGAVA